MLTIDSKKDIPERTSFNIYYKNTYSITLYDLKFKADIEKHFAIFPRYICWRERERKPKLIF